MLLGRCRMHMLYAETRHHEPKTGVWLLECFRHLRTITLIGHRVAFATHLHQTMPFPRRASSVRSSNFLSSRGKRPQLIFDGTWFSLDEVSALRFPSRGYAVRQERS